MATFTVNSTSDGAVDHSDDATNLTLRDALDLAQNSAGADTIAFSSTIDNSTITLTTGALVITSGEVTIQGDIEGDGQLDITLSGGNTFGFFNINGAATAVMIDGLQMTDGKVVGSNGSFSNGGNAAAINNAGSLTISNSVITNTTVTAGNASFITTSSGFNGGAAALIDSTGSLNLVDSIISSATLTGGIGSSAPRGIVGGGNGGSGGTAAAIISSGSANLQNTTFSSMTVTGGAAGNGGNAGTFLQTPASGGDGGTGGGAFMAVNGNEIRGEFAAFDGVFTGGSGGTGGLGSGGGPNGQIGTGGGSGPFINNINGANSVGFDFHTGQSLFNLSTSSENIPGSNLADVMWGMNGNDILSSMAGKDDIAGGAGDDQLFGGNDDDVIEGGVGNDIMDGGADGPNGDTVSFAGFVAGIGSTVGIAFNLGNSLQQLTNAGRDTITGFENAIGSDYDDTITESISRNSLQGGRGNDILNLNGNFANAIGEAFDGGLGVDTLSLTGGGGSMFHSLRDDVILSIEALRFNDPGFNQSRTVQLNANQFSTANIALNATIIFDEFADTTDTIDIAMGAQNTLTLAGLNIATGAHPSGSGADIDLSSARFVVTGDSDGETITGSSISDTLNGNGGVDILNGGDGGDNLQGGVGTDTLNGGTGADQMDGGADNDLYIVDNALDTVNEGAGGGTADRVNTSVDYTLAANQQIELFSTTNSAGTGAINLTGNNLANTILGNNGANNINGGAGIDRMTGLGGNDNYFVDNAADTVTEGAGGGTADRVLTSVDYTLAVDQQIEILSTINVAAVNAINLTGNNLANNIAGNNGVNIINGGGGIDSMSGQLGSDLYYVDNALDTVLEGVNAGTADRVLTSVDYTLGFNQQIELFSTANSALTTAINLTGNNVANRILGNNGANNINGGLANDVLTGGLGADKFVFNTAIAGGGNIDTIADFVHLTDDFQLAQAIFTGIGATLDATELRLGTTATTTTQRIVYDSVTGNVFFDAAGSAAGAQVQFAKVTAGTVLDINDFIMV